MINEQYPLSKLVSRRVPMHNYSHNLTQPNNDPILIILFWVTSAEKSTLFSADVTPRK
jgi:hypothetical protein